METKDRVRLNIYKTLLKQESERRKRNKRISATVFFALVGVVGVTSYDYYSVKNTNMMASNNTFSTRKSERKITTNEADKYFSEVINSSNTLEVTTDEMFGLK